MSILFEALRRLEEKELQSEAVQTPSGSGPARRHGPWAIFSAWMRPLMLLCFFAVLGGVSVAGYSWLTGRVAGNGNDYHRTQKGLESGPYGSHNRQDHENRPAGGCAAVGHEESRLAGSGVDRRADHVSPVGCVSAELEHKKEMSSGKVLETDLRNQTVDAADTGRKYRDLSTEAEVPQHKERESGSLHGAENAEISGESVGYSIKPDDSSGKVQVPAAVHQLEPGVWKDPGYGNQNMKAFTVRQKARLMNGEEFREQGRWSEAAAMFRKIWKETGDPDVANNLAGVLLLLNRPEEAESVLTEALQAAPEDEDLMYNLTLVEELKK